MRHALPALAALLASLALAGPAEAKHKAAHRSSDDPAALQRDEFKPVWDRQNPNAQPQQRQLNVSKNPTVARYAKAMHDPKNHPGIQREERSAPAKAKRRSKVITVGQ